MMTEIKRKTKGRVESYDKEIGMRLRALRKLYNDTQETLAQKLGITFQQVQKYEQGSNRVSAGKIKQIIDIYNVPSSYFFEKNKNLRKLGFAENTQENFVGENGSETSPKPDIFQTPETINLLKAYYSIEDEKLRKGMYKMVRTYAENIADAQSSD